jgi:HK97 family phage major capsid protein
MTSSTIVNAGVAVGANANDGTSAANSLGLADFATLEAAVDVAYRPNARWMCHPSTLQHLRAQPDKQGRPLFPGLQNSPDGVNRIFNREIVTNPFMDQLQAQSSSPTVTRKPLAFADLSRYTIRLRSPMVVARLEERWAEYAIVGYQNVIRLDANFTDQGACAAYIQTIY